MKTPRTSLIVVRLLAIVIAAGSSSYAAVTVANLSNNTIPYEASNLLNGVTVPFTLGAPGDIELDIYRLETSATEPIAVITKSGLNAGADPGIFWDGFYQLPTGDIGRQNGNFRFIYNAGGALYTIPQLLQITSVDVHGISATPSIDGNGNSAFPYVIRYQLAQASKVTVTILDSSGTVIRTLLSDTAQEDETVRANVLNWDGLNDNHRPVPLGVYTVTLDARDAGDPLDVSIRRTRTIAVTSLASISSNPQQVLDANSYVFPNPVRGSAATIHLLAVRNNANIRVRIYTLAGDLVYEHSEYGLTTGTERNIVWDAKNQSGKSVGRGLYYVVVHEDDAEGTIQTVKKVAVIP
jgi:flagellar hook assembly protein FlgD